MKISNDTIGNRSRDLPVCSAVPQPTAPPRAPVCSVFVLKYKPFHQNSDRHSPLPHLCYGLIATLIGRACIIFEFRRKFL
jgi:hypothetical protein